MYFMDGGDLAELEYKTFFVSYKITCVFIHSFDSFRFNCPERKENYIRFTDWLYLPSVDETSTQLGFCSSFGSSLSQIVSIFLF